MSTLDRLRARKELEANGATIDELEAFDVDTLGDPNEATPADRRRYVTHRRRQAREETKPLEDAYRAGKGGRGSSSRSSGRARSSARRAGRQSYRQMTRELQAPVQAGLGGGVRVLSMSLLLVALYLALTNTGPFTGVLGGVSKGLEWLSDPTRSIPYGPGYRGN